LRLRLTGTVVPFASDTALAFLESFRLADDPPGIVLHTGK
jgi:hypothetical protein